MEVISLLQARNRCLQRILKITREFVFTLRAAADDTELRKLEPFLANRDRLVRGLALYDRKITQTIRKLPSPETRKAVGNEAGPLLEIWSKLVREILITDEDLFRRVETEKIRIAELLDFARRGQQNIGKFKSSWISEAGEGIDTIL